MSRVWNTTLLRRLASTPHQVPLDRLELLERPAAGRAVADGLRVRGRERAAAARSANVVRSRMEMVASRTSLQTGLSVRATRSGQGSGFRRVA
jgi:hypothetical protein